MCIDTSGDEIKWTLMRSSMLDCNTEKNRQSSKQINKWNEQQHMYVGDASEIPQKHYIAYSNTIHCHIIMHMMFVNERTLSLVLSTPDKKQKIPVHLFLNFIDFGYKLKCAHLAAPSSWIELSLEDHLF